jgi:misacylated tRNA(Ala) deacylase
VSQSLFLTVKNYQQIDMAKSYAPRMHSAEHILNQVMVRKFDCGRCFSAHVNKKKSKCDYHFDRALTDNEVKEVEAAVNKTISANQDVTEEMVSLEEADLNFSLIRLPDGVETVRIVHIGDFDSCPCIGEHVDNTAEIGKYLMISQNFNDGVLRIRYKLGDPE